MESLTFGAWLRRRRGQLDLTQRALAYQVGCSVGTIRKLEADERRPSRQLAALLARQLAIPADQHEAFIGFARTEVYEPGGVLSIPDLVRYQSPIIPGMTHEDAPSPAKHNLPAQITPFFGRQANIRSISRALVRPDHRLLTLTGPGGTGKTRLSLQVAAENLNNYADGVFFVPLARIRQHDFVLTSIIKSLGVESFGGRPLLEQLLGFLAGREMLLLIDNFEHVVEAAPLISDLLANAPRLNILVTSRVPLHLYGERVFQVAPLALPDLAALPPLEELATMEAIQLFVDRAGAVNGGFTLNDQNAEIVARICNQLDGLPLAIELVAARSRIFSPQSMLERLNSRMDFAISSFKDLPERQRTLRATIDWSHNLLGEEEQALFRRLAVFSGGATIDAIESISITAKVEDFGPEETPDVYTGLGRLLDHNLLRKSEEHDEDRFFMLETIREYAQERLEESGEADQTYRRYADYFRALAKTAEPQLRRANQIAWLDRLETELNNLRAALSWLSDHDLESGLAMAAALANFWHLRGHHVEGREWLSGLLAAGKAEYGRGTVYARALDSQVLVAYFQHLSSGTLDLAEQSVELRKTLTEEDLAGLAFFKRVYAMALWSANLVTRARSVIAESVDLYRRTSDEANLGIALHWQAFLAWQDNDLEFAKAAAGEELEVAQSIGDILGIGGAKRILGEIAVAQQDYAAARSYLESSLACFREVRDLFGSQTVLMPLAQLVYLQQDFASAKSYLEEALRGARKLGNNTLIAHSLSDLGLISYRLNQDEDANRYFAEALMTNVEYYINRYLYNAHCLTGFALLLVRQRHAEQSAQLLGVVAHLMEDSGSLNMIFQPAYEETLTIVTMLLSEESLASELAKGRSLDYEVAIEQALRMGAEIAGKPILR